MASNAVRCRVCSRHTRDLCHCSQCFLLEARPDTRGSPRHAIANVAQALQMPFLRYPRAQRATSAKKTHHSDLELQPTPPSCVCRPGQLLVTPTIQPMTRILRRPRQAPCASPPHLQKTTRSMLLRRLEQCWYRILRPQPSPECISVSALHCRALRCPFSAHLASAMRAFRLAVVVRAAARPLASLRLMSTIPISPPRPVSESDVVKAYERDIEQSKKYEELRVDDPEIALQARRKRLMYRARQRGW